MEHLQGRPVRTHKINGNRTYPELVVSYPVDEREATYQAALKLVARIDEDLTKGIRHYRTKGGKLLTTLDEVVHAILDNDLMQQEEAKDIRQIWLPPQELAA